MLTIDKTWKQLKCLPVEEWINKTVYPYNEYYLTIKRDEELTPATAGMALAIITLSWQQTVTKGHSLTMPFV